MSQPSPILGDLLHLHRSGVLATGLRTAVSGGWRPVASATQRIKASGSGLITMDSMDSDGAITLNTFSLTISNPATPVVDFPYPGDGAVQVRFTFPSTITLEVF